MDESSPASRRPLWIALGAVALIVAVCLVVVFTRGQPAAPDPQSPAGTVQSYVTAVLEGDDAVALELVTADIRQDCTETEPYFNDDMRVTWGGTTERDDTATVTVTTTYVTSGLFGGSEYSDQDRFHLEQSGDTWVITAAPWSFAICDELGR